LSLETLPDLPSGKKGAIEMSKTRHPSWVLHSRLDNTSLKRDSQGKRDFCTHLLKRDRVLTLKDLTPAEIEHLDLYFGKKSNDALNAKIIEWRKAQDREQYSLGEFIQLSRQERFLGYSPEDLQILKEDFRAEQPDADESFFNEWLLQREGEYEDS
jgi:hypothetical protein